MDRRFQALEIDWLGQVLVKAGFLAFFHVFFLAEAAERNTFDRLLLQKLAHEFQAAVDLRTA